MHDWNRKGHKTHADSLPQSSNIFKRVFCSIYLSLSVPLSLYISLFPSSSVTKNMRKYARITLYARKTKLGATPRRKSCGQGQCSMLPILSTFGATKIECTTKTSKCIPCVVYRTPLSNNWAGQGGNVYVIFCGIR